MIASKIRSFEAYPTTGSYDDGLRVWSYICGSPIAQALHMQRLSIGGCLFCEGDAIQFKPNTTGEIDRHTGACRRADTEVGRVNGIEGGKESHGREKHIDVSNVGKSEGEGGQLICRMRLREIEVQQEAEDLPPRILKHCRTSSSMEIWS
jgi:hypothetical protein